MPPCKRLCPASGAPGVQHPGCGTLGAPDPVSKAEVIAQWHEALPRMAEMTFTYPDIGHFSEGPEMARSILEMNWPDEHR